jgi:hypothetical protein
MQFLCCRDARWTSAVVARALSPTVRPPGATLSNARSAVVEASCKLICDITALYKSRGGNGIDKTSAGMSLTQRADGGGDLIWGRPRGFTRILNSNRRFKILRARAFGGELPLGRWVPWPPHHRSCGEGSLLLRRLHVSPPGMPHIQRPEALRVAWCGIAGAVTCIFVGCAWVWVCSCVSPRFFQRGALGARSLRVTQGTCSGGAAGATVGGS